MLGCASLLHLSLVYDELRFIIVSSIWKQLLFWCKETLPWVLFHTENKYSRFQYFQAVTMEENLKCKALFLRNQAYWLNTQLSSDLVLDKTAEFIKKVKLVISNHEKTYYGSWDRKNNYFILFLQLLHMVNNNLTFFIIL